MMTVHIFRFLEMDLGSGRSPDVFCCAISMRQLSSDLQTAGFANVEMNTKIQ
jgi:hypothetical protein